MQPSGEEPMKSFRGEAKLGFDWTPTPSSCPPNKIATARRFLLVQRGSAQCSRLHPHNDAKQCCCPQCHAKTDNFPPQTLRRNADTRFLTGGAKTKQERTLELSGELQRENGNGRGSRRKPWARLARTVGNRRLKQGSTAVRQVSWEAKE